MEVSRLPGLTGAVLWLALPLLWMMPGCAARKAAKTVDTIVSPGSERLKVVARMDQAAVVFDEVMSSADKRVPDSLLKRAECVLILPGVKSYSLVVGAHWGSGFVSCRGRGGVGWTGPGAVEMKGGSFGLQIGERDTDLLLLVMNKRAERKLLDDKITLGVNASAAAGPVGRSVGAQTDLSMNAEILSWSRASGLFAGVSLQGAAVTGDNSTLRVLYGNGFTNRKALSNTIRRPAAAKNLLSVLTKYSPRAGS